MLFYSSICASQAVPRCADFHLTCAMLCNGALCNGICVVTANMAWADVPLNRIHAGLDCCPCVVCIRQAARQASHAS